MSTENHKKNTVDRLGWGINELTYLFNELLKHYNYVILTKDIEKDLREIGEQQDIPKN